MGPTRLFRTGRGTQGAHSADVRIWRASIPQIIFLKNMGPTRFELVTFSILLPRRFSRSRQRDVMPLDHEPVASSIEVLFKKVTQVSFSWFAFPLCLFLTKTIYIVSTILFPCKKRR